MAPNPNPSRVTNAQWWLWEQLHALEPSTELGGFYAFKSGYHSTRADNQNNWPDDYSIQDDTDKRGPSDKGAAIDWTFPDAQAGNPQRIIKYTSRLLSSAKDANDPRLDNWREFYGTVDGRNVLGWDTRYGNQTSSDDSHLWHIHGSESREYVESLDNKKAFLSVVRGDTVAQWRSGTTAGDDMEQHDALVNLTGRPGRTIGDALGDTLALRDYLIGDGGLPIGYPKPESPLAQMMAAGKGVTPAQVDDIVTRVTNNLAGRLMTREELAPLVELARKLKD